MPLSGVQVDDYFMRFPQNYTDTCLRKAHKSLQFELSPCVGSSPDIHQELEAC